MGKTIEFLNTLDDVELAFFVKYKIGTYTKPTQEIIKEYIYTKNLTEDKIEQLINKKHLKANYNKDLKMCPRCCSTKIRTDKVEWTNTSNAPGFANEVAVLSGMAGDVTYKNNVICDVCGYWLEDPNNERPVRFQSKIMNYLWDLFNM
ncbi:hypothetical protein [Aestuariibaculum lutulentum]|uniref:Uncharacterized protein n=1 Tax=Aestuariibaculum lutulentum TaxID=2920935 RepID=A0ABS9RG65_9FLAO|nr:hypothetical protein [Aestuariibaculum lutulentum]MCH4551902.1 hypothetical protein [Aestuariibaculum lutulentum]